MLLVVLGAGAAWAHPLGNFTISRFSALEVHADRLDVRYVIDMAEVPALEEVDTIDSDSDGDTSAAELDAYARAKAPAFLTGIRATAGETVLRFTTTSSRAEVSEGEAKLPVVRIEVDYTAPLPASRTTIRYADANFGSFLGWKEIVATAADDQVIVSSTVPTRSISHELRSYPEDLLDDPVEVSTAIVAVDPAGDALGGRPAQDPAEAAPVEAFARSFTNLVARDTSPVAVAGAIAIALGFGIVHALGPGHGKTIMAAYLVGAGGRARHAFLIGSAVSLMHTASVVALGLVTLWLSRSFPAHRVYPWLALLSGLLVVAVGIWLLVVRVRARRFSDDPHRHGHQHHHHPTGDVSPLSWKGLGTIALAGGLLPSPSALIVLLGAISLHRVAFGVVLVAAFSIGLAAALTGVGLAVLRARSFVAARWRRTGRVLPLLSSGVVIVLGVALTVRALFSF